ncbi:MAG: patatin-like phospholipase family protein [Hydrogenovibrio sp.]
MASGNLFIQKATYFYWIIALFTVVSSGHTLAVETTETKRPKIGLVLPGGGAHGLAHIGVLKELERLKIPIDYISGTSMGALVGGLYASGLSPEEIEAFADNVDWNQTFNDSNSRNYLSFRRKEDQFHYLVKGEFGFDGTTFKLPSGLLLGQQQAMILEGMTLPVSHIHDFDKLPTPFRAVATNARTGQEVILKSGDLASALRASMSVPGIFAPVHIDGQSLVDGGVTNNTPIDVVRNMGADIVIVSDIHSKTPEKEANSYLGVSSQIISSVINANSLRQLDTLQPQDILIRPNIPEAIGSANFDHPKELIEIGLKAAEAKAPTLRKLSDPNFKPRPIHRHLEKIDAIQINNTTRLSDTVIRQYLRQKTGQFIDRNQLEIDITQLYGLGFFELITYQILEENGKNTLIITATPPSWGPNFFKLKFNLASNINDSNFFNLGLRHTYMPANGLGGEWRNEINIGQTQLFKSAFYQPLSDDQKLYIQPSFEIKNTVYELNRYSHISSTQLEQQTITPALEIGYNHTPRFRSFGGYYWEDGKITIGKNADTQQKQHYNDNTLYVGLQYDSLNQVAFPDNGSLLNLSYFNTLNRIDNPGKSQEFKAFLSSYYSYKRHTVNVHFEAYKAESDKTQNIHRAYALGGFQNLSGYSEDALIGNDLIFARLKYLYRMSSSNNPLDFPFYVGATLEAGNIFDDYYMTGRDPLAVNWENTKQAGSVFVGMNSFVGPVYFAYGYHNNEHQSLYFYFGHTFN